MESAFLHSFIADPVLTLGLASFLFLLIALPFSFWAVGGDSSSSVSTTLITVSNFCLTSLLILRWWESGHFPVSNLYESLCFLAWACTFAQLFIERLFPSPFVQASATPISLICIAFASFALPERLQDSSPLVPALRSSWLVMHVSVVMCSYAALLIGSIFSIVVLFADRDESFEIRSSSVGSGGFRKSSLIDSSDTAMALNFTPVDFNRIEQLDSLSYRSITVGFLLLTVGLISGAVWANEAWGNWWSWDPKETWALICWLVYAAYLHTRISRGWQGRKSAILASIGLLIISICYIGVNLLGVGLHSYGWFF